MTGLFRLQILMIYIPEFQAKIHALYSATPRVTRVIEFCTYTVLLREIH